MNAQSVALQRRGAATEASLRKPGQISFDRPEPLAYHGYEAALDGEIAVPCTRNPLQRGGIPALGRASEPISWDGDVEGWVLRDVDL